eukprot:46170_1
MAIIFNGNDDWTTSGLTVWNGKSASYCEWYFIYTKFDKNAHSLALSRGNAPNDAESELNTVPLQFTWVDDTNYDFSLQICNGHSFEISIDNVLHMSYTDPGTKGKLYTTYDNWSGFVGFWTEKKLIAKIKSLSVSGTKQTVASSFDASDTNCVSLRPTKNPSTSPTPAPTDTPTEPTTDPSNAPSASPTEAPTPAPTLGTPNPTRSPSHQPTRSPTAFPTKKPTQNPTRRPTQPTKAPSKSPTKRPSPSPTRPPSKVPTQSPSKDPTESPSARPSIPPTKYPTQDPSSSPSKTPSFAPSNVPSKHPIGSPTQPPTNKPSSNPTTATHVPSIAPSKDPTQTQSTEDKSDSDDNRTAADITVEQNAYLSVIGVGSVFATCMMCTICAMLYYMRKKKKAKKQKDVKRVASSSSVRAGDTVTITHKTAPQQRMLTHTSTQPQVVLRPVGPPPALPAALGAQFGGPNLEQDDEGLHEHDEEVLHGLDAVTAGQVVHDLPDSCDAYDLPESSEEDDDDHDVVKGITLGQ